MKILLDERKRCDKALVTTIARGRWLRCIAIQASRSKSNDLTIIFTVERSPHQCYTNLYILSFRYRGKSNQGGEEYYEDL